MLEVCSCIWLYEYVVVSCIRVCSYIGVYVYRHVCTPVLIPLYPGFNTRVPRL